MPDVEDSAEKALSQLDRMELNGYKHTRSDDDISAYSLDDLSNEMLDVENSVEKALSQLDRIELNGKSVRSDDDISAYSLEDLSNEMPDAEVLEEAEEVVDPASEDASEVVNDPATIYSIEQLVNELFSKEV
jgi:hypothetical protein